LTETTTHTLSEILDGTPLDGFGKDLNRFLGTEKQERWRPVIDLFEDEKRLVVQAELSGIATKDVDIQIDDGLLTVTLPRTLTKNYERRERLDTRQQTRTRTREI